MSKKDGLEPADSVLELFFKTPLVKLNHIVPAGSADIYAKLEMFSPGASIKDRIAYNMILTAEKDGRINEDTVIVEPTSGNTGIGIALVCAVKKLRCILVMPESMSLERIYILKNYGAEVVLTAARDGMAGAIKRAEHIISQTDNALMLQQFKNPANPGIHRQTTGPEIYAALNGQIDAFVAGVGTGGTITGVGEYLKRQSEAIKIVAVEPANSAVLSGEEGGAHRIQGIGAGFIPEILNRSVIDKIVKVSDRKAYDLSKALPKEEGIFVGISSGAALYGALKIARELGEGKTVVTIFPDTGERYFSVHQYFEF